MPRAFVITVSDRVSRAEAEDRSGPALERLLADGGFEIAGRAIVPDESEQIQVAVIAAAADADLVVTTGGTGLAARDVTPQATAAVLDLEVPGLAEEMRRSGAGSTPNALLSRGVAGVRGRSLVINLPGSPAGATESLNAILAALPHAVAVLRGDPGH